MVFYCKSNFRVRVFTVADGKPNIMVQHIHGPSHQHLFKLQWHQNYNHQFWFDLISFHYLFSFDFKQEGVQGQGRHAGMVQIHQVNTVNLSADFEFWNLCSNISVLCKAVGIVVVPFWSLITLCIINLTSEQFLGPFPCVRLRNRPYNANLEDTLLFLRAFLECLSEECEYE